MLVIAGRRNERIDLDELAKLRQAGWRTKQLSERFGVGLTTVKRASTKLRVDRKYDRLFSGRGVFAINLVTGNKYPKTPSDAVEGPRTSLYGTESAP